ncbi:MAG: hypothetical protein LBI87_07865 [Candidatus Accumulibacter sp.]|jgi:hypothetical protein|nr:hypothetical protein [Accumulibacter sp.]
MIFFENYFSVPVKASAKNQDWENSLWLFRDKRTRKRDGKKEHCAASSFSWQFLGFITVVIPLIIGNPVRPSKWSAGVPPAKRTKRAGCSRSTQNLPLEGGVAPKA